MVLLQQHTVSESLARVRSGEIDLALIDDWSGQRRPAATGPLTFHHLVNDPLVAALPFRHPLA